MNKLMLDDYFSDLNEQAVILTPNHRLAAVLNEYYVHYQQKQNLTCWQKPNIFSINTWLTNLWQQYLLNTTEEAPYLLNDLQSRYLWEAIISADQSHNLLQASETAEALKSAWELIHQYEVDLNDLAFQLTEDYALCQKWLQEYQVLCKKLHYIDNATLPNFLAERIASAKITPPKTINLYGFTELIPQLKRLLNYYPRETCHPREGGDDKFRGDDRCITLPDPDSEITALARHAKAIHEAHPEATIGCVILDLNQRRERILQLFTQVFFPDNPFDIDPADYPFNISAGKSLGKYPIIATALLICKLTDSTITREDYSSLLLSPYIGGAESKSAERAKLDAELRRKNIHWIDEARIRALCTKNDALFEPRSPDETKNVSSGLRTFREWAQYFNDMLAAFGWPGEKSLSSEEYQVAQAWLTALENFASLDKVATPVTRKTAWQQLRQTVNAQIFQPQSPKTNIQVLGLLEAAAVPFDYLWVAGMNDISWPPQPNPHPFIPKPLQRQLNMPHATAERELNFCTTILEQFQQSAKHILFSHAQSDGKIEYKQSSLLEHIPVESLAAIPQANYTEPANFLYSHKQTTIFNDGTAPAIKSQQKISGGADVIKQQAACPFRAFASHRLHARELETSTQGLNAKDRGIILHEILQTLWNEIESSENLKMMDDGALQTVINNHIDLAITKNAPPHHHETTYITLEKQRLNKIITQWLALEKTRPRFTVTTSEQDAKITLHEKELTVRIDRIDTLSDGSKFIIDYKTGVNNSPKKWFGDRPDEPQLPLYALIDPQNTAAISFAQLAAGNIRFKGISREQLNINGIDEETNTWQEKLIQWRNTLERLAADFVSGDARTNPKHPAITCKNCAITPLCRIHETIDPSCEEDIKEDVDE